MLTIGSLFSGIGGLELGLERAGLGPVLWQAEQDPYCRRVLAKHWPEAKRYDDVRDIDENAERVDVICGGFPCQDISNAGKRAGMAGERSGLWREYARIVRELRPRFVVVENVSALLGRGFGDVLGDLAACGYDAQWDCIPAASVGAPHRRDRVFLVAWRVSDAECDAVREEPGRRGGCGNGPSEAELEHLGEVMGDPDETRRGRRTADGQVSLGTGPLLAVRCPEALVHRRDVGDSPGGRESPHADQWPPSPDDVHAWGRVQASSQPSFCRVAYGVPARSHRLRALGNAVVPQVAEVIGRVIVGMA